MTNEEKMDELFRLFDHLAGPEFLEYLKTGGFTTAPASTKYHGNYPGGLFEHSVAVMDTLVKLTKDNRLDWCREESPFIVGLFHDLCKCDQYKAVWGDSIKVARAHIQCPEIDHYEYNDNLLLKGHGDKSVMILSQFMRLTEEEVVCIRYHMGAYEKDDWQGYDLAIRKYPTVLWTHQADMIASKILGT